MPSNQIDTDAQFSQPDRKPGRALWILSQPRVGSMMLCDTLNNTGLFPKPNFQEYFYHEPLLFQDMDRSPNSSTVNLEEGMFWLRDIPSLFSRENRRIQSALLYKPNSEVVALMQTEKYRAYRALLVNIFLKRGVPKFAKIHARHRLLFLDNTLIENEKFNHFFQERDYIVIDRQDKVAQTVSLFFSTKKGQVIVTDSSSEEWHVDTVPYDEKRLLMIYRFLTMEERFDWGPLLNEIGKHTTARISHISFEDLVVSPAAVLQRCLSDDLGYTNTAGSIKSGLEKLQVRKSTRRESAEYIERFRSTLRKLGYLSN